MYIGLPPLMAKFFKMYLLLFSVYLVLFTVVAYHLNSPPLG